MSSPALVIIPAFNEERSVAQVVREVRALDLPCLVVDDASHDRTAAVARAAGATVLSLPFNLGVGGALRCGFKWAVSHGASAVVQCDGDGQHPPAQIPRMLTEAEERGVHLLIGSRFASLESMDVPVPRRLVMRFLALVATRLTGTELTDATSGFRVIREPLLSEFARHYPAQYLGDTFEAAVLAGRHGFRVSQTKVQIIERPYGTSSARPLHAVQHVLRVLLATSVGHADFGHFDGLTR